MLFQTSSWSSSPTSSCLSFWIGEIDSPRRVPVTFNSGSLVMVLYTGVVINDWSPLVLRSDGTGAGSAHSDVATALTLMLDGVGVGAGSAHKDFLIFVSSMLSLISDGTGAGSAHSDVASALTLMLDGVGVGAGSAHKDFLVFVSSMLSLISDVTGAGSAHNDSFVSFRFRVMHTCR